MLTSAQTAEIGEGVRNALAHYAHVTDDRQVDGVVSGYAADGVLESGSSGARISGHDEIRAYFSRSFANSAHKDASTSRHLLLNAEVTAISENEAEAVSDFILVRLTNDSWHIERVVRWTDRWRRENGRWLAEYRSTGPTA